MNILNPLDDLIPAKYRKATHALLLLASIVGAAWFAADGDWKKFAASIVAALYAASNEANTKVTPPQIDASPDLPTEADVQAGTVAPTPATD